MIVEEDAEYTIIVNIAFEKSNLAQSTVNVNANGENMTVIQTNWYRPVTGLLKNFARLS